MPEKHYDFCVYVLVNPQGQYYVGKTNWLERRLHRHQTSLKRGKQDYELLCYIPVPNNHEALQLERQVMKSIRLSGHPVNTVYGWLNPEVA